MKQDMIVILDLGSHENTVLARAIRALGVYSEIYPHDITAAELKALPNVKGIIINGGPNNVVDGVSIDVLPEIYEAGFPVMAAGHDKALCEVKLPQFTDDVGSRVRKPACLRWLSAAKRPPRSYPHHRTVPAAPYGRPPDDVSTPPGR